MSLLDNLLSGIMGNGDAQTIAANLAEKVGLSPESAQAALAALAQAHPQAGDTVTGAADATGLSPEVLKQVLSHLGGEGILGTLATSLLGGAGTSESA